MPTTGEKFKEIRRKLGLTQAELAKKLKMKQPIISMYEVGLANPSYKVVAKLISLASKKGIKVKSDDLLKEDNGK